MQQDRLKTVPGLGHGARTVLAHSDAMTEAARGQHDALALVPNGKICRPQSEQPPQRRALEDLPAERRRGNAAALRPRDRPEQRLCAGDRGILRLQNANEFRAREGCFVAIARRVLLVRAFHGLQIGHVAAPDLHGGLR